MRPLLLVAIALSLLATAVSAARAQGQKSADLVGVYADLNELCRGGAGDYTDQVCEIRQKVSGLLRKSGYCFGKRGQSGGEMWWHRCTASSLR